MGLEAQRPKFMQVSKGRRLLYWCLQFFGWGTYFGYSGIFIALSGKNRPLLFVWPLVMLSHLLCSHALRAVIQRNGWIDLPFRKLFWRLFGMWWLLAVIVMLIVTPVAVVAHAVTLRQQLQECWVYMLFSVILFALWSLLYLAFQYFFRYRDSELQRLQLEASLREAELRALKAQVNPHFLFNCLNNLRSLVAEDGERAREMLLRLSELLRYALEAGGKQRVPLGEELEVVRAYLDLEKLQFEERLSWVIDVPGNAMSLMVPPMLIQQLVENAIKHGIGKRVHGGEIVVRAQNEAGCLSVRVENTGELLQTPNNGFGLANARDRLLRLCGAGAALTIENVTGGKVAATAEIPLESP